MLHARFKLNLRFKTVGEAAARLCALAIYAAGARLLGAEGFGLFSLAFSYSMLATVLIDSGTLSVVTRNLARDKSNASPLIRSTVVYKSAVAPFAVAAICLLAYFLDPGRQIMQLMPIAGLIAAGTALGDHVSAILSGIERMEIEAGLKVINRAGTFLFAVGAFFLHRSVESFTFGMAIGVWVSVGLGLWWIHRNVARLEFRADMPLLKDLLRSSVPLFVSWLFITIYGNQDRYILGMLDFSERDIGIYSASAKLIDALRPIPVLLIGAVYPIVSEAAVKDKILFERISATLVKYSVIGLFPFAFGVTVFAPFIVRVVFGPEFAPTASILAISIWGFVGIFINCLFLYLLVSANQQRKFLQGSIILMVVNAPLCWVLFQSTGLEGGAWALIASESALLLFNVAASSWARSQIPMLFGRPAILAASSLLLFSVLRIWIPDVPSFIAAIGLYVALVWRSSLVDVALLKRFVV